MKIESELIAHVKNSVDPESVLNYLGFKIVKRSSRELRGPCKVHGGDNITGFRFNLETRTWCCYTRHCEGDKDRDIVGLVQKVLGCSFPEAVKFLAETSGIDLNDKSGLSEKYFEIKQQQAVKKEISQALTPATDLNFLPESTLEPLLASRSNYFIDRGFPKELLDFYEVGGYIDSMGVHRETIPIRDEYGNLLTISARRTDSIEDTKYLLLKDVNKTSTLYNLDVAKNYVGDITQNEERTLILVEGFVDVWGLAMQGVYNAVAAMGTDIAPSQRNLLCKYCENVIIMLDPDKAGRLGSERMEAMLSKHVTTRVVNLPEGKDPKYFNYQDVKLYIGG